MTTVLTHPEKYRMHNSARYARLRNAFVEHVDPFVVFQRDEGICGICDKPVDITCFHVDHVIPLAKGGEHSYANTQLAHSTCNLVKSDMIPRI